MHESKPAPVSVFHFLNAREFLQKAYDQEKRKNPDFSHRYIAKALNAGSSSFFKDVLHGRARLNPARVLKFARLFHLSRQETEYLEYLVMFTQAETEEEKEQGLRRLNRSLPPGSHVILEAFQLEYLKKWHYAAVLECLAIHDFKGDYEELGRMLQPPITAAEARNAIQLLVKLKLARKTAQGHFEKVTKVMSTGFKTDPQLVKPGIRANLELALRGLEEYAPAIRPYSYLTVSVSEESLLWLRDKLRALRREVLEMVTRDEAVDRVYQLNFQLFPVSRTVKRGKA